MPPLIYMPKSDKKLHISKSRQSFCCSERPLATLTSFPAGLAGDLDFAELHTPANEPKNKSTTTQFFVPKGPILAAAHH